MGFVIVSVVTALLTRIMFAIHCLLATWRTVDVYDNNLYWLLLSALLPLAIETVVTIIKRKGEELKWFCPSFFIYLTGCVPAIWFLELDRLERSRVVTINGTTFKNLTLGPEKLSAIKGIEIPLGLDADMWVNAIENTMLLLLIIGRWLLPKGEITRDQLSQLLFVYIGMASDIMELYDLFQEEAVLKEKMIAYVILGVWTLSLVQFSLVLTATKARKPRVALNYTRSIHEQPKDGEKKNCCSCRLGCCETEVWSILIMVILQDGPFLSIRLYCLITFEIFTYNIIFFTAKNLLVILLQFYRLMVIICEVSHHRRKADAYDFKLPISKDISNNAMSSPTSEYTFFDKKNQTEEPSSYDNISSYVQKSPDEKEQSDLMVLMEDTEQFPGDTMSSIV